jgi:CheY-like chemotaxis protein
MTEPLQTILLVDDDKVTNILHQRQIARRGLARQVAVATDGQEALEFLQGCMAEPDRLPELVLLDINMPRMNGFEFLEHYAGLPQQIRDRSRVFMVSTSSLRRDIARAEDCACVAGYESKPLSDDDLERMVSACQEAPGRADA